MSTQETNDMGLLHVILHEPRIAHNTGAIGRTCVATGATLWLVRPLGFHLDDRHVRRAGLDYWPRLKLRLVDRLDDAASEIGRDRLWFFSTKGAVSYTSAAYRSGDGLVFGGETQGLPRSVLDHAGDRVVRIPIDPAARSLNLSNAVAIGVFEAVRQIELRA